MKEGKGETAWVLMELCEAWRGWGAVRPTAVWQGLPVGGSHHFLPLWEHERITPHTHTHLYFLYLRSSEAQRQGVTPFPHLYAGKVPLWSSPDIGKLGEAGTTTWEEAELPRP